MNREQIIAENYEYVTCNFNNKSCVRIFKPYNMGDIPTYLIIDDAITAKLHSDQWEESTWELRNPNYGANFAAYVVIHRYGMVCDYFVCALLIRPYSSEACGYFMTAKQLDITDRLELGWDSREFDKSNHYKRDHVITKDYKGNNKVNLWHLDKERLGWIEDRLTQEQIMERAKTLRPVGKPTSSGLRYWVDGMKIHSESYHWKLVPLKPTGFLTKLSTIVTYHKSRPFFAKPSVDECVAQCPFDNATAFMITRIGSYNGEIDRLECETTYYKGDIPKDILERKVEW